MAHRPTVVRSSLSILLFALTLHGASAFSAEKRSTNSAINGHDALCQLLVRNIAKVDTRALTSHVIGQSIDMNSIRRRLEKFTGVTPLNDGLVIDDRGGDFARAVVRRLIFDELKAMGLEPSYETFNDGARAGANVVVTIKGTKSPKEVVEVTAHYDSVGNPGADDNGSGFTLVMELAQLMLKNPPEKSVRFVLMDLEEQGFGGSLYHSATIKAQAAVEDLIGVIVLDTIAWAPKDKDAHLIVLEVGDKSMANSDPEYKKRVEFAKILMYQLQTIRDRGGKVQFSVLKEDAKPSTADHGPYWRKGLPAVLIGEAFEDGLITPEYHQKSDTLENLNWDYYTEVSRIVAEMLAYAASARLPDDFQISEDLVAALAGKDDPAIKPAQALPAALKLDPFLPPKPKHEPTSYRSWDSFSSSKPISKAVKEAKEWIEDNSEADQKSALVSIKGKEHSSFVMSKVTGKPKYLDISGLSKEELVQLSDEMFRDDLIYAYVTTKDVKTTKVSDAERAAISEALMKEIKSKKRIENDDFEIEYGVYLNGALVPVDMLDVDLDMEKSPLDYLRGKVDSDYTPVEAALLIIKSPSGNLKGGLVTRDLDEVNYYIMNENLEADWIKLYKVIAERTRQGDLPPVITIDPKGDLSKKELEDNVLKYLWSTEGRGKIKYDLDYNMPGFLKGGKAGKK